MDQMVYPRGEAGRRKSQVARWSDGWSVDSGRTSRLSRRTQDLRPGMEKSRGEDSYKNVGADSISRSKVFFQVGERRVGANAGSSSSLGRNGRDPTSNIQHFDADCARDNVSTLV